MKIITILKFIGAGILALLAGLFGMKQGKKSADKKIEEVKNEAAVSAAKEQAAIEQTKEVVQTFEKEQEHHEQTIENVQEFIEVKEKIEEIQEEADEKTEDIVNSDIADKLEFMRNKST